MYLFFFGCAESCKMAYLTVVEHHIIKERKIDENGNKKASFYTDKGVLAPTSTPLATSREKRSRPETRSTTTFSLVRPYNFYIPKMFAVPLKRFPNGAMFWNLEKRKDKFFIMLEMIDSLYLK